jgi:outer membrane protein OmpA-like peptidoglycan-associated protein
VVKAISAPFDHILSILDGQEKRSFIDFQPGGARLGAPEAAKLGALAKALREHPTMSCDIEGRADPARDGAGLRHDAFVALAERRARAVRDALARSNPDAIPRIFVVSPSVAGGAGSRVELRLKTD